MLCASLLLASPERTRAHPPAKLTSVFVRPKNPRDSLFLLPEQPLLHPGRFELTTGHATRPRRRVSSPTFVFLASVIASRIDSPSSQQQSVLKLIGLLHLPNNINARQALSCKASCPPDLSRCNLNTQPTETKRNRDDTEVLTIATARKRSRKGSTITGNIRSRWCTCGSTTSRP